MKIWIVTNTKYPSNDAPSIRNHLMAKLLLRAGHEVCIYSRGKSGDNSVFDTVPFVSLRGEREDKAGLLVHYYIHFPRLFLQAVRKERPDAIIVYNIPTFLLLRLIGMQKKFGFRLMHDCVEWYSKEQFEKLTPMQLKLYYQRDVWMRYILPRRVGIIAISRYLERYFQSKDTPCAYLPSLCDCEALKVNKKTSADKVVIAYAGLPGKKDSFAEILQAIDMLDDAQKERIELHIIGATPEQVMKNAGADEAVMKRLRPILRVLPRMSHDEVMRYFEKVDFTVLIRPENIRYAQAGFPTKVPESLVTGTPVLCNLTSDLGDFLTDGYDAVILKDCTQETVCEALVRMIGMSYEDREKMYLNARKTAETKFDYRLFEKAVSDFAEKN